MKIKPTSFLLITLIVLLFSNLAWGQKCFKSSIFMEVACGSDAKDDFWTGFANCKNLRSGVLDCYEEQFELRAEAMEECGVIKESRDSVCDIVDDGPYAPMIDPDNFLSPEDAAANPNPFFPLVPGTVMVYEVTEDVEEDEGSVDEALTEVEVTEIITVTVTEDTREIAGVECFVVNDIVRDPDGEVLEDTDDYYAVDVDNNVWYFGEIAQNFEDGFLTDLEGSFIAGIDGAKPGIIMLASPMPGDAYRQEFALGDAEDFAVVVSLTGDESTNIADCADACLVINDLNALEPEADESKFHKAGIGVIVEVDNEGTERVELISITNPQ